MSRDGFSSSAHGLRGVASSMVFLAHLLGGTAEHVYADRPGYVDLVKHPWNFGVFGVEIFFVISGFVILPSAIKYSPKEFAARRIVRLYPTFLFFTALFVALNAFTNAYPKLNDPLSVLSALFFLDLFTGTDQITPNAWSLTHEVVYYLLTYLSVYFVLKNANHLMAALTVMLSVAFVVAFPISVYFLAGLAIRILHQKRALLSSALSKALELPTLLGCIFFASLEHSTYEWEDFSSIIPLPTFVFTSLYLYFAFLPGSLSSRALDNRIFAYLGTVSYSLYLVHPYTYFFIREMFRRFDLFSPNILLSMILFIGTVVPLTMLVTHVIHVTLERGPYQWFFGQRIYRTGQERTRFGLTWGTAAGGEGR